MKHWILALLVVIASLGLTQCAFAPDSRVPVDTYDLAYNMTANTDFAEFFDGKSPDEWAAMGSYTILLKGLHTTVLVDMNGMDVLAVRAYDQTAALGAAGTVFEDDCPVSIRSTQQAVVVNCTRDYSGETVILTQGRCYQFQPADNISTQVFVQEDGTFSYYRYWGEYVTSFDQWDTAPLELCTGRDHFLYETGHAEILNGEVILTPENTVTVADEYDLDAMFADAKASGMFAQYETVDALLAANQAKANET